MQFRISIKIMYSLICTLSIRLSCGGFYVCCAPRWTMYNICWYLTNCYVTEEPLFPPILWAEAPSHVKCTNNGPESFHIHFNEQFYCSHPSIYVFIIPRSSEGEGGIYCFTSVRLSQDIFCRIFLSNYWWQKSDIWS